MYGTADITIPSVFFITILQRKPSGRNLKTRPTVRASGWVGGLVDIAAHESNHCTVSGPVRLHKTTKRAGRTLSAQVFFSSGVKYVAVRGLCELRAARVVCFAHPPCTFGGQSTVAVSSSSRRERRHRGTRILSQICNSSGVTGSKPWSVNTVLYPSNGMELFANFVPELALRVPKKKKANLPHTTPLLKKSLIPDKRETPNIR